MKKYNTYYLIKGKWKNRKRRILTYDGFSLSIGDWAKKLQLDRRTIKERLRKKSIKEALTMPKSKRGRPRKYV